MIAGIILGCYALAWLYTARALYGRWRAKGIDRRLKDRYLASTTAASIDAWNEIDRGSVMIGALAVALLWPLVPAFILLIRLMDGSPQLSRAEMRDRLAERDRRIAELERENGLTPR
jgi:hypothetical protein